MAARAHDVAALVFRGKSACLNFGDSAWRLPVPASSDPKDIRRAAADAAEAFRPHHEYEEVSDGCSMKVSNSEERRAEEAAHWPQNMLFADEEAVFDMLGLLVDMAEGLLLSPPYLVVEDDTMNWNVDMGKHNLGISLWSY